MSTIDFKPAKGKRPYPLSTVSGLVGGAIFMGAPVYMQQLSGMPLNPITLFLAFFFLIGLYLFTSTTQGLIGARMYRLDSDSVIVTHGLGKTKIPLRDVVEVRRSQIRSYSETHRNSKGKSYTDTHFMDIDGNGIRVRSGLLPYCGGMFISTGEGDCVLLGTRKKDPVALTPSNPEEMARAISDRLISVRQ